MSAGAADANAAREAAALLRTTAAIRERAAALLARARRGDSAWFTVGGDAALHEAARIVADVTRERFPSGAIPLHSRWRHFEAGRVDRRGELGRLLGDVDARERARAQIDLALVSVLLDAGAGAAWSYVEASSGQRFARSEGLGVASFRAFTSGLFSSDPQRPLRVDAAGLSALAVQRLADAFQVSDANPLVGLDGRTALLHRLGEALRSRPDVFGRAGRPGGLFDALAQTGSTSADKLLSLLLDTLSRIWPAGNAIGASTDPALALGDCWRHAAVRGVGLSDGWMPFHKLSQWLCYSLLEPFEWVGVRIHGQEQLTALPEYRNGGLLLDCAVIVPRDPALLARRWQAGDEFVVEWRALTVALIDELAPLVRERLGRSADEMPLGCLLEGGTWAAGRAMAQRLRGGAPPLEIDSDGTVF